MRPEENRSEKKFDLKKYRGLIVIAVLAIVAEFFLTGKIGVDYGMDYVTIQGGLLNETIYYSDVTSVEQRDSFTVGNRVSGVDTLHYRSGEFRGGDLDCEYKLFMDKQYQGTFLIITTQETTVVVGSANVDLQVLYDTIDARISQRAA